MSSMNASYQRPRFTYQSQKEEGKIVYFLQGILDQVGGEELRTDYEQHFGSCCDIVFNLSEIRIISSGGLTILVEMAKELKEKEIVFRLTHPSDMVLRTLKVVHIDRIINIES